MTKIPTAEEYLNNYSYTEVVLNEAQKYVTVQFMTAFAKIHVEAALKAASDRHEEWGESMGTWHDTTPILNAYPLDNVH